MGGTKSKGGSENVYKTDNITLSTGVVLSVNRVSVAVFGDIESDFPLPKIPVVFDTEREREIENPAHPDYIAEVARVGELRSTAALDRLVSLGTKLVSVPEGMIHPDSPEWVEQLELLGHPEKADKKLLRYVHWVRLLGATSDDWEGLILSVLRISGVVEGDVKKALDSFRNNAE